MVERLVSDAWVLGSIETTDIAARKLITEFFDRRDCIEKNVFIEHNYEWSEVLRFLLLLEDVSKCLTVV